MSGKDYLYNELLEFCSGDLNELERVLDYFKSRLDSDREIELEKDSTQDEEDGEYDEK